MLKARVTRRRFMHGAVGGAAAAYVGGMLPWARALAAVPAGGDLVIADAASDEPASLDAQVDPYTSGFLYASFVSDPLVVLSPAGKFVPGSGDGLVEYIGRSDLDFTIRDGVTFQDGNPCDAAAVKFNVDRVMNPDTHSALLATDLGVSTFLQSEVVGRNQVRVIYQQPFPSLLSGVSVFPLWSPAAVRKYGSSFQENLVGQGAFKLASWVRGDHITYVRNPNYGGWSAVQEHRGPAYLSSITIKFVGSQGVLGEILKTGQVNMVIGLPAQNLSEYQNNPAYRIMTGYQPGNGLMFTMNTGRPPLDDLRVRQALRYAYDQGMMNKTLYDGTYVQVYGPLTKYTLYYWKGAESAYRYNPDKARALLDEAGWKMNTQTGIREKDGKPLSLTIVMLHHQEIGRTFAAQFKAIGVNLQVALVPGPVQLQRAQSGDFDLIYERLRTLEPDILFSEFYSKNDRPGGWAWSHYQNAALDAALLQSQQTGDPQLRAKYFVQAQQLLTANAVYLPTLDDPQFFAMSSKVTGFKLGATGAWFFAGDMSVGK